MTSLQVNKMETDVHRRLVINKGKTINVLFVLFLDNWPQQ